MKQYLMLKELAELFDVSERHLYRQKAAGRLPLPVRIGRCDRWDVEEFRRHFFVDPSLLAQQLSVSFEEVEQVSRFLHRMNILRLWLRLVCPNPPELGDDIILEWKSFSEIHARFAPTCMTHRNGICH
jgi:predicted DNA-binding transcriptional regulator AlpA